MNFDDVERALALVALHFPKTRWPDAIAQRFGDALVRLPLTYAQAESIILDVRLRHRWPRIEPAELLGPLQVAAGAQAGCAAPDPGESRLRALAAALARRLDMLDPLFSDWRASRSDGAKFAHWTPSWLVDPEHPHAWHWGKQFLRWLEANRPDVIELLGVGASA